MLQLSIQSNTNRSRINFSTTLIMICGSSHILRMFYKELVPKPQRILCDHSLEIFNEV
ncbi:hypothetical protein LEP1GSC018_1922 [Leptospira kirschneri str. 2008720114]|nr:hypothetical protein LEP1GSC018_1922 [Leptospira kirschneri str. 2008720114]